MYNVNLCNLANFKFLVNFIPFHSDLVAVDHLDCDLGINEFLEVWDFFT